MAHHVAENICIHGRQIHAFGQDGVSDVHSTDIPTHVGPERGSFGVLILRIERKGNDQN
jgi:hypothetical protein